MLHRTLKIDRSWLAAFGAALLAVPSARADFVVHSFEDQYAIDQHFTFSGEVGHYGTQSNYGSSGATADIGGGFQSYTRFHGDVQVGYGITPSISAFARLSWARADLQHDTRAGTTFGLSDQSVGATYRLLERLIPGQSYGLTIDLQFQTDLPAYSNSNSVENDTPFLGDGSIDLTPGAFVGIPFPLSESRLIRLTAGAGYTLRTGGFSAAVPWSVIGRLEPVDGGITFSAGFLGLQSLSTDSSANAARPNTSSGGSFVTNAINPSLISFRGQLGYRASPDLTFFASGSKSVWGDNAANGVNFTIGMQARISTVARTRERPASRLTPTEYGKANRGFVNYGLEARVTRANDRLNLIKISKGSQDGVEVGQVFDIFKVRQDGSIVEAIARAKVSDTKLDEAALTVLEYFKEVWIDTGFIAKRVLE